MLNEMNYGYNLLQIVDLFGCTVNITPSRWLNNVYLWDIHFKDRTQTIISKKKYEYDSKVAINNSNYETFDC